MLIRSYYGRTGLDYNLGRINMGGCDFSTRPYTYCDVESPNLEHFELQEEDILYKVFTINKLMNEHQNKTSGSNILFFIICYRYHS